ncbi:MAG: hypothetical protein JWP97_6592 [Labilithrix sp.]|nr:hypothetical protein [Labilithrix sp.]
MTDAELTRGVYALAKTKRKKLLWCAWWTGAPSEKPFRPPDAYGGGARTEEEARQLAEKAAGRSLEQVDGHWAGAWKRVLAGLRPFPSRAARVADGAEKPAKPVDPYALLGVTSDATLDDVKLAFRKKALEHHPDRGGDSLAFIAMKRAYDGIVKRRERRRRP